MKNNITAQNLDAQIMSLSRAINQQPDAHHWHSQMQRMPEWCGADLKVTTDLNYQRLDMFENNLLIIQTRHARQLTWLLLEIRDAFGELLTFENKHEFYACLGAAAQKHLAQEPEAIDHRPLLRAVLTASFKTIPELTQDGSSDYTPSNLEQPRMGLMQWLQADSNRGQNKGRQKSL
ncbi:MAG: hypothetical protein ACKVVO_10775 [Opitutaceae bacterium]